MSAAVFLIFIMCISPDIGIGQQRKEPMIDPYPVKPEYFIAQSALQMYQGFISPVNGHSCLMIPSCSEYSRQVICRDGLIIGLLQSTDRLNRCGHDLNFYQIMDNGLTVGFHDPIKSDNNPFASSSHASSQEGDERNPDSLNNSSIFADALFREGEYLGAALEYRRLLLDPLIPASERHNWVVRSLECYRLGMNSRKGLT